jgi:arabinogalactan endo-1,4-beta-galactosidase
MLLYDSMLTKSKLLVLIIIICSCFFLSSVTPVNAQFAKGADIGWLSQMESLGYVFKNDAGQAEDCMQILKDKGVNSLRFRVWVNPDGGWCGKKDVATMALRAKKMGFRIMIDFHYSDSWADPSKQAKPTAWTNHTIDQLKQDVYDFTYNVLDTLKTLGITPEWVQIGNETNDGMLWPEGKASINMANFSTLVTSGYNAVKAVNETIKVIVHISNGYDNSLFRWIFDGLKNNNAKWDVVGMSLYPDTSNWPALTSQCLANMTDMVSRYGKEIIISEVGMDYNAASSCKNFLSDIISKTKSVSGGLGVFYWEPECYNWQDYKLGAWNPDTKQPTIALNAFSNATVYDTLHVTMYADLRDTISLSDYTRGKMYLTGDFTNPGGNWKFMTMEQVKTDIYRINFDYIGESLTNDSSAFYFAPTNDWTTSEKVSGSCNVKGSIQRVFHFDMAKKDTTVAFRYGKCPAEELVNLGISTAIPNVRTSENLLNIFPNPVTDGTLHIVLKAGQMADIQLNVYNLNGQLIVSENEKAMVGENNYTLRVNNEDLASALYVLKLTGIIPPLSTNFIVNRY